MERCARAGDCSVPCNSASPASHSRQDYLCYCLSLCSVGSNKRHLKWYFAKPGCLSYQGQNEPAPPGTTQVPVSVYATKPRPFSQECLLSLKSHFEWSCSGSVPKSGKDKTVQWSSTHTDAVNVPNCISKWLAASEKITFTIPPSALNSYWLFSSFCKQKKKTWWKLM